VFWFNIDHIVVVVGIQIVVVVVVDIVEIDHNKQFEELDSNNFLQEQQKKKEVQIFFSWSFFLFSCSATN